MTQTTESSMSFEDQCTCDVQWQKGTITFSQLENPDQTSMPMLHVGDNYGRIYLWKKDAIVTLCVRTDQMKGVKGLKNIVSNVRNAANTWNKNLKRITFKVVEMSDKCNNTTYEVVYNKEVKSHSLKFTYADCQFPNNKLSKLNLYPYFVEQTDNNQTIILTHELGHALGFFHESSAKGGYGQGTVGIDNPRGIMGYGRIGSPPSITESDIGAARYIYDKDHKYINGQEYMEIHDKKMLRVIRIVPYYGKFTRVYSKY